MPRITISIPSDLKRQLSDPRVKNTLNISRICQQALWREVRRILDLPLDLERMEALLRRLRLERDGQEERWFSEGSAVARHWVEHSAPLVLLRQLGEAPLDRRLARVRTEPPEALAAELSRRAGAEDFHADSFLTGWAVTLGLMWEMIKRNL